MARPTITSITAWRNSNYSYILFGGSLSGSNKCMALVGQRFGVTTDACLGRASASLSSCNISSQTTLWSYSISNRYPNNPVNYPVTNISLSPSNVVYGTICSQ